MALTTEDLSQISTIVTTALKDYPTKIDLDRFATKDDLERFATKKDLERFATKLDLDRMESRVISAMGLLERDAYSRLDDHEARLTKLERAR